MSQFCHIVGLVFTHMPPAVVKGCLARHPPGRELVCVATPARSSCYSRESGRQRLDRHPTSTSSAPDRPFVRQ